MTQQEIEAHYRKQLQQFNEAFRTQMRDKNDEIARLSKELSEAKALIETLKTKQPYE